MSDIELGRSDAVRHDEDFRALRSATSRDPQSLNQVVRSLRERRRPASWKEWMMSLVQNRNARPWLSAALATGLAVIALLVIPISYEKTTGHSVKLEVSGKGLTPEVAMGIAKQLQGMLGKGAVTAGAERNPGGLRFTFGASVPANEGARASAVVQAFAGQLTAKGFVASASTTPIKERVSTSVYAYAKDRVIQVSLDGKSAAQIQAEIQQRLTEAGITGAQVSVFEGPGAKEMGIKVMAEQIAKAGQNPPTGEHKEMPQLVLTKNGVALGEGKGFSERISKLRSPADGTTLVLDVTQDGKAAQAKVSHSETLSDDAITASVQQQLDRAGLSVTVKTTGGMVEVSPKK